MLMPMLLERALRKIEHESPPPSKTVVKLPQAPPSQHADDMAAVGPQLSPIAVT